ncbi:MAG: stage III sporulation protein AF [Faecalimonas sp.]|nr:stage III sporulation protein AF [Faecalimonas sp.]
MLDYIYEWMENIAFYMVIVVSAMQMVSGESYKKYIRFFAGMILILLLTGPILKIFGMSEFQVTEYQKELEEIENATKYMEQIIGE